MDTRKGGRTYQRGRDSTIPPFSLTVLDTIYQSINDNSSNGGGGAKTARSGANRAAQYLDITFVNARDKTNSNANKNGTSTTATSRDDRHRYHQNINNCNPQKKNYHQYQREKQRDQSDHPSEAKNDGLSSSYDVTTSAKQSKKRFFRDRFRAGNSNTCLKKEMNKATNPKPLSPGARLAGILNVLCSSGGYGHNKKPGFRSRLPPAAEMIVLRRPTPVAPLPTVTPRIHSPPLTVTPSLAAILSRDGNPHSRSSSKSKKSSSGGNAAGSGPRSPMMMWNPRYAALLEEREMAEVKEKAKRVIESEMQNDDSDSSSDLFELESLETTITSGSGDCRRYSSDLPVCETSSIATNRSITRGLIVSR